MDSLQPQSNPNDSKRCDQASGHWSLGRGELAAWALVVLLLPALPVAFRSSGEPAGLEVRVEGPRPGRPAAGPAPTLVRLDLNQASVEELDLLPGIGSFRARKIVAWRNEKGPFRSVWELTQIPGFSQGLVTRLEPLLIVRPETP
jgi:competence ComEA-like helix-hairpin-helix protein